MSFEKSKCNFIKREKIKEEQISLDSIIGEVKEMEKILWANAHPEIEIIEPLTKEASVSGKVYVEIVCLDKENEVQIIKNNIPFLTKIHNENIENTSKININMQIVDVSFQQANSKINVVINFETELTNFLELEILNGGDENICIKEEEITSQRLVKEDFMAFNEEMEIEMPKAYNKILSVEAEVFTDKIQAGNNFFTVEGTLKSNIFVCTQDEFPKIECITKTQAFTREIEAGGVNEQSILEVNPSIKFETISYESLPCSEDLEEKNQDNKINLNIPINVKFELMEEIKVPCAVDIFALKNNIEVVTSSFEKTILENPINFIAKIDGSVSLDENEPRIDKICGFSKNYIHTTNQFIKDEELTIEGVIGFNVIYLNDENQSVNAVKKEIPFIISEKVDVKDDFSVFSKVQILDLDVSARRGREILVDAKIFVSAKLFKCENGAVITDAVMGEPLMPKEEAIEIYFAQKGEDIWQIAKELKAQMDVITSQNPDLISPLEEDRKIIVYHQKTPYSASILSKKDYDY